MSLKCETIKELKEFLPCAPRMRPRKKIPGFLKVINVLKKENDAELPICIEEARLTSNAFAHSRLLQEGYESNPSLVSVKGTMNDL